MTDFFHNVCGLVVAVLQLDNTRLARGRTHCLQALLKLLGVACDAGVGDGKDFRNTAVIGLEFQHGAIRVPLGKIHDVAEVRPAPRIDALKIIAHHHQVAVLSREGVDPLGLDGVGVLVFVDHHIPEPLAVTLLDLRVFIKQREAIGQQIVEIHRVQRPLAFSVDPLHLDHIGRVDERHVGKFISRHLLDRTRATGGQSVHRQQHLRFRK